MRKRIGIACILLGIVCILSSIGIILFNWFEDQTAKDTSQALLEDVQSLIDVKQSEPPLIVDKKMSTVKVDGDDCIGILSVPALDLKLPVLTDWSYAKLKKAPCHYYGSYYEKDFVIAAHNYKSHFGRLSELQKGDYVYFTDANGLVYSYEVVITETLPKQATKEMITSGFDLSLYTCTRGGGNRVTVRCKAIEDVE